jgi:predicted Ser/Thr protein kinase
MDAPEKLGKYEIRGTLGRGAMGTVYDGWDPLIARRVAIKTVPLPENPDPDTAEEIARFKREAQAAGRLTHPNIVGVYDYGETEGLAYIVMEFVEGPSLKALLDKQERFALSDLRRVMEGLLGGLQFSHERGVVHRDIKPANIMLTREGQAKIADFGIARIEASSMTQAGTMLGTPAYMSPEQFMGQVVDARSDVYSAGVVLYQLLTGERPFDGGLTAIMHKVLNTAPVPPSQLAVTAPVALDAVVLRAMAKRPEDRYPSAAAFAEAIRAALEVPAAAPADAEATMVGSAPPRPAPPPPQAAQPAAPSRPAAQAAAAKPSGSRLPLLAGVAAAAVVVLVGGGWFLLRPAPAPAPLPAPVAASAPAPAKLAEAPPAAPAPAPADTQPSAPAPQAQPSAPATQAEAPPAAPAPQVQPATPVQVQPAAPPAQAEVQPAPAPQVQPVAASPVQPAPATPSPVAAVPAAAAPPAPAAPPPAPKQAVAAPPIPLPQVPAKAAEPPPQPPPVALAGLAPLRQMLGQARCAVADAVLQDSGTLSVAGLAGSSTAAALRQQAAGLAGATKLDWRVQGIDPVFCTALDVLRPVALAPEGLAITLAGGRTALYDGERIRPRVTMPGFAGELRVDYLGHDGSVVHLYPTAADPAQKVAAQPPRRFAPGEVLALGDAGPGKPIWEVGPPYGTDMIVAIASSAPLLRQMPAQNAEDSAGAYLHDLAAAITAARQAGAQVAAALLPVDTLPKK